MAQNLLQNTLNPPAQPVYILRGHTAPIHAVTFLRKNTRLLTGDAEGWVVLWSTCTKRPQAVWKAHTNSILGLSEGEPDQIITHGRDNKIQVWHLPESDEPPLSKTLPIDHHPSSSSSSSSSSSPSSPTLLHTLPVNALTFCSFTSHPAHPSTHPTLPSTGLLLATPGVHDSHINLTALPTAARLTTIPPPPSTTPGMLMALGLAFLPPSRTGTVTPPLLAIVAGYESGQTAVFTQQPGRREWTLTYLRKAHAQPILSLGIAVGAGWFFTSGADAVVARHVLGSHGRDGAEEDEDVRDVRTKHAGQQGLCVRDDERVFATAGWDGRVRVYATRTLREVAVLAWHGRGCYALAFADVRAGGGEEDGEEAGRRRMTVAERRDEKARTTHWLAAGSKDGKVSLWDIY